MVSKTAMHSTGTSTVSSTVRGGLVGPVTRLFFLQQCSSTGNSTVSSTVTGGVVGRVKRLFFSRFFSTCYRRPTYINAIVSNTVMTSTRE